MAWPAIGRTEEKKTQVAKVVKANNEFALALYGQLRTEKGNLFFSPFSISDALALASAGAKGETLAEMYKTLHFTLDQKDLAPAFKELIEKVNGDPKTRKYQLTTANALWGQKGYGFLPAYVKLADTDFHAAVKEVNFAEDKEKARQTINQWVEEQTKEKIKDLLQPGVITADTRLVLTNAIYFKAAWAAAFNEEMTKKEDFRIGTDTKIADVPMMHKWEELQLVEDDSFQILELPYENHQLSLIVVLPKKVEGLADLEKALTADNLAKWQKNQVKYQVELTLPKFKLTAELKLKPTLESMGTKLAFSDQADFTGITESEKLMIGAVIHKAYIDLHEKGTEAAAATAITFKPTSIRIEPIKKATFRADHPFVFLIRDNATGSILFMGRVTDPLAK